MPHFLLSFFRKNWQLSQLICSTGFFGPLNWLGLCRAHHTVPLLLRHFVLAQAERPGDPNPVPRLLLATAPLSESGEPIMNSPGGMSTSFMSMELVISTATPSCLAQESWWTLAFFSSKGAIAGRGVPGGSFQLPSASTRLPTAGSWAED